MIKRYNQFVKENKTNEEYEYYPELDTPVKTLPSFGGSKPAPITRPDTTERPAPVQPTPFPTTRPGTEPGTKAEFGGEEEEVAVDPYTGALQSLADAAEKAGLNYDIVITDKKTISAVKINDKEVTFPSETQKYHVEGVKKPFDTLEEVLAYFDSGVSPEARQEVRDEMTSISDEEVLDRQEQFESKSYKSTRIRK
jgi:hypothetical protein